LRLAVLAAYAHAAHSFIVMTTHVYVEHEYEATLKILKPNEQKK